RHKTKLLSSAFCLRAIRQSSFPKPQLIPAFSDMRHRKLRVLPPVLRHWRKRNSRATEFQDEAREFSDRDQSRCRQAGARQECRDEIKIGSHAAALRLWF